MMHLNKSLRYGAEKGCYLAVGHNVKRSGIFFCLLHILPSFILCFAAPGISRVIHIPTPKFSHRLAVEMCLRQGIYIHVCQWCEMRNLLCL